MKPSYEPPKGISEVSTCWTESRRTVDDSAVNEKLEKREPSVGPATSQVTGNGDDGVCVVRSRRSRYSAPLPRAARSAILA